MKIIELTDFSAYYKLKKEYLVALDNISLDIDEGEFVTIVGPSGCGKSTLLKCILGQVGLTDGTLLLGGKEPAGDVIKEANIAYISQDTKLFPHLNVYENIAFPLRMAEADPADVDAKVRAIAKRCGLEPAFLNRRPRQLSLGQQQRVALARAFVKKPSVILADEPFSHLDTPLRAEFQELIHDYHVETNATILFVTHDNDEALTLGGRLLRMGFGVIEAWEDVSRYGKSDGRKVTQSIPEILLNKEKRGEKRPVRNKLLYRWPVYLLGVTALVFLISMLWGRLTESSPNEKLSVCFVGQNFLNVEAEQRLSRDMGTFTNQGIEGLTVDSLYNDNGALLAEALTIRVIGDTDFVILEDDYVFDGIGGSYFSPIPTETVERYFPGAQTYEESGVIYGVLLYSPQNGSNETVFSEYYYGEKDCWLFFTVVSENAAGMNGKGSTDDTAALDLAAYLWRENR